MNFSPTAKERATSFLLRRVSKTDPTIFSYSTKEPSNPESDALAIVSRALLFLRLATGSAHGLLDNNDIDAEILEFWWKKLGESRGIWPPGAAPTDLYDLWADVQDSLNAIADVEDDYPQSLNSFSTIASSLARQLSVLASHERVGFWGLCPS